CHEVVGLLHYRCVLLLPFPDPARPDPHPLSLHDALPIFTGPCHPGSGSRPTAGDGSPTLATEWSRRTALRLLRSHGASKSKGCRSEEHTSELQSRGQLVCRLLLEKKNIKKTKNETQIQKQ